MSKNDNERIVAVATIYGECIYSKDGPAEHGDLFGILSQAGAGLSDGVDGFIAMDQASGDRRFVDRSEAKEIAIAAHQLADSVSDDPKLISPHIFW